MDKTPRNVEDIPALPGWITLADAAHLIGISKQGIHKRLRAGGIRTAHRVGNVIVIRQEELERLLT